MNLPTEHEVQKAIREKRKEIDEHTRLGNEQGAHDARNKSQVLVNTLDVIRRRAGKDTVVVEDNDLYQTVVDR